MNLTEAEIRILRRDLAAVDSLFQKGLLAVAGAHVDLSEAGQRWLAQDDSRIRQARSAAGKSGGTARGLTLTRKERVRIAYMGGAAANAERRKRKKKGGNS